MILTLYDNNTPWRGVYGSVSELIPKIPCHGTQSQACPDGGGAGAIADALCIGSEAQQFTRNLGATRLGSVRKDGKFFGFCEAGSTQKHRSWDQIRPRKSFRDRGIQIAPLTAPSFMTVAGTRRRGLSVRRRGGAVPQRNRGHAAHSRSSASRRACVRATGLRRARRGGAD